MNRKRGLISKKVSGKMRTFHFSINAWLLLCEIHGIGLPDLNKLLSDPLKQGVASRDLLYCAAAAYCREEGIEEDFNRYTAGLWYEEMPVKDYQEIEAVMLDCTFLKGKKKR